MTTWYYCSTFFRPKIFPSDGCRAVPQLRRKYLPILLFGGISFINTVVVFLQYWSQAMGLLMWGEPHIVGPGIGSSNLPAVVIYWVTWPVHSPVVFIWLYVQETRHIIVRKPTVENVLRGGETVYCCNPVYWLTFATLQSLLTWVS